MATLTFPDGKIVSFDGEATDEKIQAIHASIYGQPQPEGLSTMGRISQGLGDAVDTMKQSTSNLTMPMGVQPIGQLANTAINIIQDKPAFQQPRIADQPTNLANAAGGVQAAATMPWNTMAPLVAQGAQMGVNAALSRPINEGLEDAAKRVTIPSATPEGDMANEAMGQAWDKAVELGANGGVEYMRASKKLLKGEDLTPKEEAAIRSAIEFGANATALIEAGHGLKKIVDTSRTTATGASWDAHAAKVAEEEYLKKAEFDSKQATIKAAFEKAKVDKELKGRDIEPSWEEAQKIQGLDPKSQYETGFPKNRIVPEDNAPKGNEFWEQNIKNPYELEKEGDFEKGNPSKAWEPNLNSPLYEAQTKEKLNQAKGIPTVGEADKARAEAAATELADKAHVEDTPALQEVAKDLVQEQPKGISAFRRKQGGYVSPDLIGAGAVSDLIKKIGPRAVLDKFEGTFKGIKDWTKRLADTPRASATVVFMSPDEFHSMAQKRSDRYMSSNDTSGPKNNWRNIRDGLNTEEGLDDMPHLHIVHNSDGTAKVVKHEGRHRFDIARERGIEKLPVRIISNIDRASPFYNWDESAHPHTMIGENNRVTGTENTNRIVMPESAIHENPSPRSLWDRPSPLGGVGKKQGGAIGFKSDPEFQKFKDNLPEILKPRAKALYAKTKELQKPDYSPSSSEVKVNAIKSSVNKKITDLYRTSVDQTHEQFVQSLVDQYGTTEDIPDSKPYKVARNLVGGTNLLANAIGHPVVQRGVKLGTLATRNGEAMVNKYITNPDTGLHGVFKALSLKDKIELTQEMKRVEGTEEQPKFTNDKVKAAHEAFRKVDDTIHGLLNEELKNQGKSPILYRSNHVAGVFRGDWQTFVHSVGEDGTKSIQAVMGSNTRGHGKKLAEWMKENHPEWEVSEPTYNKNWAKRGDTSVLDAFLDMMGEQDPRKEGAMDAVREFQEMHSQQQLFKTTPTKYHFKAKKDTPVLGAEGFKPWESDKVNAGDMLHSQLTYLEGAMKWLEVQKIAPELNALRSDPKLNTPNAKEIVRKVVAKQMGVMEYSNMNQLSDAVVNFTGMSPTIMHKAMKTVNKVMQVKMLSFNPAFLASQVLQPVQVIPAWLDHLVGQGVGNRLMAASATLKAQATMTRMAFRSLDPFEQKLVGFAKDNGVINSYMIDKIDASSLSKFYDVSDKLATGPAAGAEHLSRYETFLTFSHFLKDSGEFSDRQLMEVASTLTDNSMVNYRQGERARVYDKLGAAQELTQALTTYKHNKYSQYYYFAKQEQYKPLMTMLGTDLMMAGVVGLVGVAEFQLAADAVNKVSEMADWDFRVPFVRELMLRGIAASQDATWQKALATTATYGAPTTGSGIDMSNKFSSGRLTPDGISPYTDDLLRMTTTLFKNVFDHTSTATWQTLHAFSPEGAKGYAEQAGFTKDGVTRNPRKPEDAIGIVHRDAFDWVARDTGTRSLKERMQNDSDATEKVMGAFDKASKQRLTELMGHRLDDGKDISDLANQYLERGGEVSELENFVDTYFKNQHFSAAEKARGLNKDSIPQTNNNMRNWQTYQELGGLSGRK